MLEAARRVLNKPLIRSVKEKKNDSEIDICNSIGTKVNQIEHINF
jgi:hypothetical protein